MYQSLRGPLLGLAILGISAASADAHTHLKKSIPAAGATLASAPSEIRLQFDEAIEARFSKVSIEAKGGQAIVTGAPTIEASDKTTLVVKLPEPLKAGSYKVNWQAISVDTHKVKGSFTFQVRP